STACTAVPSSVAIFESALCSLHATPPTAISSLSLHDALPISHCPLRTGSSDRRRPDRTLRADRRPRPGRRRERRWGYSSSAAQRDRKSTRLNSSHVKISYAVFCLKKKMNHDKAGVIAYNSDEP